MNTKVFDRERNKGSNYSSAVQLVGCASTFGTNEWQRTYALHILYLCVRVRQRACTEDTCRSSSEPLTTIVGHRCLTVILGSCSNLKYLSVSTASVQRTVFNFAFFAYILLQN